MFFFLRRLIFLQSVARFRFSALHPDQLFLSETRDDLAEKLTLRVPSGQSLCFFQGDTRSAVFASGKHLLTSNALGTLDRNATLTLVILQHEVTLQRSWETAYPDRQDDRATAEPLTLAGGYRVTLQNAERFCDFLISVPVPPAPSALDDWIARRVVELVREQSVSIADIREHSARLGNFLGEAIRPVVTAVGLDLVELNIAPNATGVRKSRQTIPPDFAKDSRKTAQIVNRTDAPQALSTAEAIRPAIGESTAAGAAPQTPRLYYRVHRGTQIGPIGLFELQEQIDQGLIGPRDLLWKQGMNAWRRASEFDELHWAEN